MGLTRGFALLAYDSQKSSDETKALHAKANRRNLLIKIPGARPADMGV
jgi:transaldolase